MKLKTTKMDEDKRTSHIYNNKIYSQTDNWGQQSPLQALPIRKQK